MAPNNNDDWAYDENEEEEEGGAEGKRKRGPEFQPEAEEASGFACPSSPREPRESSFFQSPTRRPPARQDGATLRLPLSLGRGLELRSLGQVDPLHPRFHTATYIYPIGYQVRTWGGARGAKVGAAAALVGSPGETAGSGGTGASRGGTLPRSSIQRVRAPRAGGPRGTIRARQGGCGGAAPLRDPRRGRRADFPGHAHGRSRKRKVGPCAAAAG